MEQSLLMRKSRPWWSRFPRRVLELTGVSMIAGMALLTLTDVTMRTLFNSPVRGAYDVNVYWFMVGITAVGLWYAEAKREHISVGLISERLSGKASLMLDIFISLVSIATALAFAWYGLWRAIEMFNSGEFVGADRVPVWHMRYVVVIGAFAYAIALLIRLGYRVTGREEVPDDEEVD